MKAIRVLLADDHTLVRAGIRSLVERIPGVVIAGEASTGREALDFIKAHRPTVVLMDIAMSGLNGLEAATRVTKEFPGVKVVILSMYAAKEYVAWALRSGVSGYLLKEAATVELDYALRAIARGEIYLSPAIPRREVEEYLKHVESLPGPRDPLTPRQREVLQLIAEGRTTKEIAGVLKLSAKTVETHRAQIMERLQIHDVASLVRYALRKGIVTLDH